MIDIVVVGYRPAQETERVLQDAPALAGCDTRLLYFDNTGNPKNLSQAWNDLAMKGKNPYIAFLNNDAIPSCQWGTRLTRALERNPWLGAVLPFPVLGPVCTFLGSKYDLAEPPSRETMNVLATVGLKKHPNDEPIKKCAVSDPGFFSVMFRRREFEELRGFDERFRLYGQDRDVCDRLRSRGLFPGIALACPFFAGRGRATQLAIHKGDIDIRSEYKFCTEMTELVRSKRTPRWDALGNEERLRIRKDVRYRISEASA